MDFRRIKAVISDMDGVLWRGKEALPGVAPFFGLLREQQIPFVLATNNSGRHPREYVERMAQMGVAGMSMQQIVTSGTVTANWLRRRFGHGARLFVIGNPGLIEVLQEAGFTIADQDVQAVVAGIDYHFSYEKARHATLLIRNHGAYFVGTNPDVTFPTPEGLAPGAGSILSMLEVASGVAPAVMGKPQPAMFEAALEQLGIPAEQTLMIGDRLDTDIDGAVRMGMMTALVRSGVWDGDDHGHYQPDLICDDLQALYETWQAAR